MTGREQRGGDQDPLASAYTLFMGQYNQAIFGVVASDEVINAGETTVGDQHFSDLKLLNIAGLAQIQFLDDLETGASGLHVVFNEDLTGPQEAQIAGVYAFDYAEGKVLKWRPGGDEGWSSATEFELEGVGNLLRTANELHAQAESEKLPETLQNRLKTVYETIISGHSDHPLIKMGSYSGEADTTIDSTIVDAGIHLRLSRHVNNDGQVHDTIHLNGPAVLEELQSSAIVLNFDTSLFFVWDERPLHFEEERLVYIGQTPFAKKDETERQATPEDKQILLTPLGAEYIIGLLSRYESGEGFVIDPQYEAITPPTAELREKLADQLHRLVRGEMSVDDMQYTNQPDQEFHTHTAALRVPGIVKRKLKLEVSEAQDGDCRIALGGLRVPDAIDNLEFSFDFSTNKFTVRRTLEDTTSLNVFKTAFLETRQSYRIDRGYYAQSYLMSQLQARIMSEFLEQLEAGEVPF